MNKGQSFSINIVIDCVCSLAMSQFLTPEIKFQVFI